MKRLLYRWFSSSLGVQYRLDRRCTRAGSLALGVLGAAIVIGLDTNRTVGYQVFTLVLALVILSAASSLVFRGRFTARRILPRFASAGVPVTYRVVITNQTDGRQDGLVLIEELTDPRPSFEEFVTAHEPGEERRNWFDRQVGYPRWAWLVSQARGRDPAAAAARAAALRRGRGELRDHAAASRPPAIPRDHDRAAGSAGPGPGAQVDRALPVAPDPAQALSDGGDPDGGHPQVPAGRGRARVDRRRLRGVRVPARLSLRRSDAAHPLEELRPRRPAGREGVSRRVLRAPRARARHVHDPPRRPGLRGSRLGRGVDRDLDADPGVAARYDVRLARSLLFHRRARARPPSSSSRCWRAWARAATSRSAPSTTP